MLLFENSTIQRNEVSAILPSFHNVKSIRVMLIRKRITLHNDAQATMSFIFALAEFNRNAVN